MLPVYALASGLLATKFPLDAMEVRSQLGMAARLRAMGGHEIQVILYVCAAGRAPLNATTTHDTHVQCITHKQSHGVFSPVATVMPTSFRVTSPAS